MPNPIVFIHGWNSNGDALKPLAQQIATATSRPVSDINLANYISLNDHIIIDDLIDALQAAWIAKRLPTELASTDVVVHSTGGLIIRGWIARYYQPNTVPIKHLLMLAPANFGSPLAQKGRSLLGRVIIGSQSSYLFQTGAPILKALETASSYTWDLALQDRFGKYNYYRPGNILCTVLIGNRGLSGLSAAVNEIGTDGVVRLSAANMNCAWCDIDFREPQQYQLTLSKGKTAFGIIDGENHETITGSNGKFANPDTFKTIINALTVSDDQFNSWIKTLNDNNQRAIHLENTALNCNCFQNTVCHLEDQHANSVNDYFLEFTNPTNDTSWVAEKFHGEIIRGVHAFSDDPSYRSLFIDTTILQTLYQDTKPDVHLNISAEPQIKQTNLVGFTQVSPILLDRDAVLKLFQPNRTLFVDMRLQRLQTSQVLQINSL
ncbi:MAG: alpha/beta hydrolase [Legionellales bacterium]|nr:alpha/beta hydrolase [Legionellales bacterium]